VAVSGLSSGTAFLMEAANAYFTAHFQGPTIMVGVAIHRQLSWIPTIHFRIHDHLTIAAEVSEETPYPLIFNLRRTDVLRLPMPVAIYCVCPEELYLTNQPDAKRVMNDGYGLLTVAADGTVQRRASCIPLIQQITEEEFVEEIRNLPRPLRVQLAEAFDRYNHSAPSGAAHIAEIMEGLVLKAGREAAAKGWISRGDARPGAPANTLIAMQAVAQFHNATAPIGAAQAYIAMYRNPNHHFPKDRKQAAIKYRDCRHSFLEGLRKIVFFRDAMRSIGLSGKLA
jgi:hypothetical protein